MTKTDHGILPRRTCCSRPDLPHPDGRCPGTTDLSRRLRPVHVEPLERRRIFGVDVTAITSSDMLDLIATHVKSRLPLTIFHQNLHSAYLQQRHESVRTAYTSADVAYIDGMPFVVQGRLLGGAVDRSHRNTYLDWYDSLLGLAQDRGWKVFFLGGTPEALSLGCDVLRKRFPALELEGHDGYFDATSGSPESQAVIEKINDFEADVVLIGMGMPRQEVWVADNRRSLKVPVTVTVGAGMDYVAGLIPTPPRWMGKYGVEWIHRLCSEPKRLWQRYLLEPIFLVPVWAKEVIDVRFRRSTTQRIRNQQDRPRLRSVDRD